MKNFITNQISEAGFSNLHQIDTYSPEDYFVFETIEIANYKSFSSILPFQRPESNFLTFKSNGYSSFAKNNDKFPNR